MTGILPSDMNSNKGLVSHKINGVEAVISYPYTSRQNLQTVQTVPVWSDTVSVSMKVHSMSTKLVFDCYM